MRHKTIVILLHEKDPTDDLSATNYFVRLLKEEWGASGLTVRVVRGIDRFVPADLLIPHIDLTVIPDEYRQFMDQYPVVINRDVIDTSKSKISTHIVERTDPYRGPVIVKTNLNVGGLPEKQMYYSSLSIRYAKLVSRIRRKLKLEVSWKHVKFLDPKRYPIYSSLQEVPDEIFKNPSLVVEKFLPEMDGDKYCLRNWLFFADKGINVLSRSHSRIVKAVNTFDPEEVPVPDELYSIRQQLKVNYGKLDYVLRDGKVVLFDVNRTPTFRGPDPSPLVSRAARLLAEGIWSVLPAS